MTKASRVVSPCSSGLPPHPTVKSHCCSSHVVQPWGCSRAKAQHPEQQVAFKALVARRLGMPRTPAKKFEAKPDQELGCWGGTRGQVGGPAAADCWRRHTCVTASSALRVCSTSHAAAVACVKGQVFSTSGKAGFSGAKAVEGAREPAQAAPRANREVVKATTNHMTGSVQVCKLCGAQAKGFLERWKCPCGDPVDEPVALASVSTVDYSYPISGVQRMEHQDGGQWQQTTMPVGAKFEWKKATNRRKRIVWGGPGFAGCVKCAGSELGGLGGCKVSDQQFLKAAPAACDATRRVVGQARGEAGVG